MKYAFFVFAVIITSMSTAFAQADLAVKGERHLTNIKQLTFGGENAEAYFSFDGKQLIFQSKRDGHPCDRIYRMNIDGSNLQQVSNGEGRTTCSYFFKDGKKVLYASTHGGSRECPPPPDFSKYGYVWAVYPDYEIYTATPDGKNIRNLTNSPGYDAEATVSPNGKKIVFTSERDGDLGAQFGQTLRVGPAEAARPTGDDCDTAVELAHSFLPWNYAAGSRPILGVRFFDDY